MFPVGTKALITMVKWANLDHHLSLSESVGLRLLVKMFEGSICHYISVTIVPVGLSGECFAIVTWPRGTNMS